MINRLWLRRFLDNALGVLVTPLAIGLIGFMGLLTDEPWPLEQLPYLTCVFGALVIGIILTSSLRVNASLPVSFGQSRIQTVLSILLWQYGLVAISVLFACALTVFWGDGDLRPMLPLFALMVLVSNLGVLSGILQQKGVIGWILSVVILVIISGGLGALTSMQLVFSGRIAWLTLCRVLDKAVFYAAVLLMALAVAYALYRFLMTLRVSL